MNKAFFIGGDMVFNATFNNISVIMSYSKTLYLSGVMLLIKSFLHKDTIYFRENIINKNIIM
jgi:hypothetical protein